MTMAEPALFDPATTAPIPWWRRRIGGLDTETTGPEPREALPLSIALAMVGGGGDTWSHTWVVNPGVHIPAEATAVNGIHDEDVADAPPFEDVAEEIGAVLLELIEQNMALVAYNATYDCTVLDRALRRAGRPDLADLLRLVKIVDPMVVDRILDTFRKGKRKLPNVTAIWEERARARCEAEGRPWRPSRTPVLERDRGGPHDAAADAIGAARAAWLLAAFGEVYTYGQPIRLANRAPADMVATQNHWINVVDDLDQLHEFQKTWRYQDQLRLRDLWRSEGNPLWENVDPRWPVYPEEAFVG